MFAECEKKIIKQVRKFIKGSTKTYNFWLLYDDDDVAYGFEGGYELSDTAGFRNDYYIKAGKNQRVMRTPLA